MTNKTKNIFLLDDEFPIVKEFVDTGIYENAINSENLYHLALNENWKSLHDLQQLIKDIVTSKACKEGLVNLIGFTKPEQCLLEIDKGFLPDVVIYDWQYGIINDIDSQKWLLEILNTTNAFVFIYSKVGEALPFFLNKEKFNQYSPRFQLFIKGSKSDSIFYSEEFILQYILGEVSDSNKIKIHGFDVEFTKNKHLTYASDILYLERIFGKLSLLEELKKVDFNLNKKTIDRILDSSEGYLFYNEEKKILINPDNKNIVDKMQSLQKISFKQVAEMFSIKKLEEALERGVALI